MGKQKKEHVINLFWTGGWDSTYRLLDLILTYKKKVQPHYLIDPNRKSTRLELKAMDVVKEMLLEKDTGISTLLFPVKYAEIPSIKENLEIANAYERLVEKVPLGIQYEWMARYCAQSGIDEMELSIEQGDNKFNRFIEPLVIKVKDGGNDFYYRIDDDCEGEERVVFGHFKFPILHLSRLEMETLSKKRGYYSILKQTWFCHTPVNNKPCGICDPCITTIKENQKWRIPFKSRIRYFLYVSSGLRKLKKNSL